MADDFDTLGTIDPTRAASFADFAAPPQSSADPGLGRRIGPYRIESLIARGGMGAVYLAVREDDFQKRVALKLVRPELQSVEILRRFAAERQILAGLEHPNIARLLDGGSTDDMMPFLVMEYVEGVPLNRYCDEKDLSLDERLELFQQVCSAVHFAHQNLVIHRDLKPSNILVTAAGEPKLLDFGIAKIFLAAAEGGAESQTADLAGFEAEDGGGLLTPAYASPEQLLGETITTASDVYSLGVVLYQLLCGRLPYRLDGISTVRGIELVCGQDPPSPSSVARTFDSGSARRLEGDVDAIVGKAMRRRQGERYESALEIADDIRRTLGGLPVRARPSTWSYRSGKFVKRHKLGMVAALFVVLLAVSTTVLWRQAVHDRAAAQRAQAQAEKVSEFLERLFRSADPERAQGGALTARELVDRGREELVDGLTDEPEVRADLLAVLGTVYQRLGFFEEARELKEEALADRRAAAAGERTDLAGDLNNLAGLHYKLGEYDDAEERYREALAIWRRLGEEEYVALALFNLTSVLIQQGRFDEALARQAEALAIRERIFGPQSVQMAASLYSLGALHRIRGDMEEAEPLLLRALQIYRLFDDRRAAEARVLNSLGRVLHTRGRLAEGREHLEAALALRRQIFGEVHVDVASSAKNLAAVLLDQGQTVAAGSLLEDALATLRGAKPAGHWAILEAESVWGSYLAAAGYRDEAEPFLVDSYHGLREIRGEVHAETGEALRRVEAFHASRRDEETAAEHRPATVSASAGSPSR
ncbi:MAG: tetratricopeptide repeat protein [Acidobacteriota bacterium]